MLFSIASFYDKVCLTEYPFMIFSFVMILSDQNVFLVLLQLEEIV